MRTTNFAILGALLMLGGIAHTHAQDSIQEAPRKPTMRLKVDGIAAVVGDYVILDSDIEKTLIDLRNQGASPEDVTRCGLLGKLMEDRMYA
ncbi:MAG: hypothetical protein R3356_00310, partial [Eudoraea sp.]|nr:hypothetical protein [Eudoraea sp.]